MDWVDIIHYPALVEHLRTHDSMIRKLSDYCRASPDPDGEGLLDGIEEEIGHGFFYMQRYMIQRKRDRANAYLRGPRVGSHYLAQVINAAANYWKHVDEWPEPVKPKSPAEHTLRILDDAGATNPEYRLSQLLRVLEPQGTLSALLPRIVEWREAYDCESAASAGKS